MSFNFPQLRSEFEIKKLIRSQKQRINESFDEFRNAVLKLAESLQSPLSEAELVEILLHNLRSRVRQQLLYVTTNSLYKLRRLCLKDESLANEIGKISYSQLIINQRITSRRIVNEIQDEDFKLESLEWEIDEIKKKIAKGIK